MNNTWRLWGAAAAGAVAMLTGVTVIADWFSRPRPALTAVAEFGPYAAPPKTSPTAGADSSTQIYTSLLLRRRAGLGAALADSIAHELTPRAPGPPAFDERVYLINAFGSIRVVNEGTQAALDVRIVVDDASVLCVERERQRAECFADSNVVRVPALQSAEQLEVKAWMRYPLTTVQSGDVRLTHAGGVTDVTMRLPAHPRYRWIEQNAFLIVWSASWLALLAAVLIWLHGSTTTHAGLRETAEADDADA